MHGWVALLKEWPSDHERRYNRPPSSPVVAFRRKSGEVMRWGMVPGWAKEFDSKYATFNARIESVADKPTFRNAWNKQQRCLIPMAGYYEWVGEKGDKQPVYITDPNAGLIVAAGLWESWGEREDLSCTMLTMPSDRELEPIHPRMPVMLEPNQTQAWLSGDIDVNELKRPNLIYHPVSKAVGNVRNESERLIEPIDQ